MALTEIQYLLNIYHGGKIVEKIKTATGKMFDCDYFNPFPPAGQINLRVLKTSFATVATIFSDPRETVQMWCGEQYAAQYTKLIAIIREDDAIRVVLGRE